MTMADICAECRNYFIKDYSHSDDFIHAGNYTISDGKLTPSGFLKDGQYFRICGSALNDGVYKFSSSGNSYATVYKLANGQAVKDTESITLTDETFNGTVWEMFVPRNFIELCDEILEWYELYGKNPVNRSPYTAESFGGYSYSKGTGNTSISGTGTAITWEAQFADALNRFRRVYIL